MLNAAKMANKKISSRTVGTDVVVMVIHAMQQQRVDELCVGKNRWYGIKLSCFYFIHSHGAIKYLLVVVENGGKAFHLYLSIL